MKPTRKKKIALIGYGQFGRFMAKHLRPYAQIVPIKRDTDPQKLADADVVIFAVPYGGMEAAIECVRPYVRTDALIVDVTSVKQKPIALMKKYFKHHAILGTHPIFGPQSGKRGIVGLPIVLCNVSVPQKTYTQIKRFLKAKLMLRVIEQTPKQHDRDMAEVQGLAHFIGRALTTMQIRRHTTDTQSYAHLVELAELLKDDSWELYKTIQNTNPEARKVRTQFLAALTKLENNLQRNL